jgi:hypothetical protein
MKKRQKNLTLPHQVECAIRGVAHGTAAVQKLATFVIEQQKPEFDAQGHLLTEAADQLKKALTWVEQGRKEVT